MAIVWGAYSGGYRLGVDAVVSGQHVELYVYGENEHNVSHSWRETLVLSGAWSGSRQVQVNTGFAVSRTLLYQGSAEFTGTRLFEVSLRNGWRGGTMWAGREVTISPPAPAAAVTPTNVVVDRLSDLQHRVRWSRQSTYSSVSVFRGVGDGQMVQIGVAQGNAFEFTDTGTQPNSRYFYWVRAHGAGGSSGLSDPSAVVYTTPAAPGVVSAARVSGGISVDVARTNAWADRFDVEVESGGLIGSNVRLPFTHSGVSLTASYRYRVRARVGKPGGGDLVGDWSDWSQLVSLAQQPGKPTLVEPASFEELVAAGAVTIRWRHNPLDGSVQQAAEVRYRPTSSSDWRTVRVNGVADSTVIQLQPGSYLIEVRTKGAHASFSDWSNSFPFTFISKPVVSVSLPKPAKTPVATVAWEWSQAEGEPQQWVEAELFDGSGQRLEHVRRFSSGRSLTFNTRLVNKASYRVRLRAATSIDGVWSDWFDGGFNVEFTPPAKPVVVASWNDSLGAVTFTVTPQDAANVITTTRLIVEREDADGQWVRVFEVAGDPDDPWEAVDEQSVTDFESPSRGLVRYRVLAVGWSGASAERIVEVVADSAAVWLSAGVGFTDTARVLFSPQFTRVAGRGRALHRFSGRSLPVAYVSEHLNRRAVFSGELLEGEPDNSSLERLQRVVESPSPVLLLRTPDGGRMFGVVDEVSFTRSKRFRGVWEVSFAVTECDRG